MATDTSDTESTASSEDVRDTVDMLEASVWSDDELVARVAACRAWKERQAQLAALPEPTRVVDCRGGCTLDAVVELSELVSIDVLTSWDDGDPDTLDDISMAELTLYDASGRLLAELGPVACGQGRCAHAFVPAGTVQRIELRVPEAAVVGTFVLYDGAPIDEDLAIRRDLTLDDTTWLHGSARIDDEPLTEDSPGRLRLEQLAVGEVSQIPLTASDWGVRVVRGDWRVAAAAEPRIGRCSAYGFPCIDSWDYALLADVLELNRADVRLDIDTGRVSISGRVTNLQDDVQAFKLSFDPSWYGPVTLRGIEIDADGRYEIELYPGTYEVRGVGPNDAETLVADALEITGDTELDVVFDVPEDVPSAGTHAHATVLGSVWFEGHRPSTGVSVLQVTAYALPHRRYGASSLLLGGEFELRLQSGSWELSVDLPGSIDGKRVLEGMRRLTTVHVEPDATDEPVRIDVELPPRVPLAGLVDVFDDWSANELTMRTPWASASHRFVKSSAEREPELWVASYVMADVYDVFVGLRRSQGGLDRELVVRQCQPLSGVERVDVDLRAELRRAELRVVDPTGLPLTGGQVILRRQASLDGWPTHDDDRIERLLDLEDPTVWLLPGLYRIDATARGVSSVTFVEVR